MKGFAQVHDDMGDPHVNSGDIRFPYLAVLAPVRFISCPLIAPSNTAIMPARNLHSPSYPRKNQIPTPRGNRFKRRTSFLTSRAGVKMAHNILYLKLLPS